MRALCAKPNGQARYLLLRGPKVGPMWIRIMFYPGGARISNMDTVPVAVDDQVLRVTENLRVTRTGEMSINKARQVIQGAWRAAVAKANFGGPRGIENTCAALDPALWWFGRKGCSRCEEQKRRVAISPACDSCIKFPPPDLIPSARHA